MRNYFNNKGQLQLLTTGVIVIFIMAVVLIFGLLILDEAWQNTWDTSGSATNQTIATVNEQGDVFTDSWKCGFNSVGSLVITNATGTELLTSTNYTTSGVRGATLLKSAGVASIFNNTDWNVSYVYVYGDSAACDAANATIPAQGKFAGYIDLIVLAIVITIIISLIIVLFSMRTVK